MQGNIERSGRRSFIYLFAKNTTATPSTTTVSRHNSMPDRALTYQSPWELLRSDRKGDGERESTFQTPVKCWKFSVAGAVANSTRSGGRFHSGIDGATSPAEEWVMVDVLTVSDVAISMWLKVSLGFKMHLNVKKSTNFRQQYSWSPEE